MTNYRITICKYHGLDQFKFCFACGSPLKEDENDTLACSKCWVHCRIFLDDHDNDHDDCDANKRIE